MRLSGLTAEKTYTFQITARDAAGNESEPSQALKVTMPSGTDLALKKSLTTSSYSEDNTPQKAVDGDLSTRWAQGLGLPDPSWIQVDLGASYDVNGAITTFEKASGYKYRIEVSPDEVHWKTLADHTAANTTTATDYAHTDDPVAGRFVRLTVTGSSGNGGSIYDFQVYGTPRTVTDHTAPTAPGQPTVKPLLPGLVDVSWPAATDDTSVTSYVVYQDGRRIGVTDATALRVSGLTADTEYSSRRRRVPQRRPRLPDRRVVRRYRPRAPQRRGHHVRHRCRLGVSRRRPHLRPRSRRTTRGADGPHRDRWPVLLPHLDLDAEQVLAMESQHRELTEGIAEVQGLMDRWQAQALPEDRDELVEALRSHHRQLCAHLDEEEREVMPLVALHVTEKQWHAVGERGLAETPRNRLMIALGAILEDSSPDERQEFLARLPVPARVLWKLLGQRQYHRETDRIRVRRTTA